jgi:hypothetical protein
MREWDDVSGQREKDEARKKAWVVVIKRKRELVAEAANLRH